MKYLRTFIALPIKVENQFLVAREELMEQLSQERITWVKPENYHVTIRFLGNTSPGMVEKIRFLMRERISFPAKAVLRIWETGSFGPRNNPRVIWVGFKEPHFFDILRQQVETALAICGIEQTDQAFRAHLTLGRVRGLKDLQHYYGVIESMKKRFSEMVIVDRLVFYKSELESGGPVYTPIEEVHFSDQAF